MSSDPGTYAWLVESLLRLHRPKEVRGVAGQTNDVTYCGECSRGWPCRTAQLAGVEDTYD